MPKAWFHIMWSTFGTWLPGDGRGFRNHQHRIHSDHDYTTPEVTNRHVGLRRYSQRVMHKPPVRLDREQSRVVLRMLRIATTRKQIELLACSVSPTRVHLLAKFDEDAQPTDIGQLKRVSSRAIPEIRGRLWGARWHDLRIRDRQHQASVFRYIVAHAQKENAVVWTFRDGC